MTDEQITVVDLKNLEFKTDGLVTGFISKNITIEELEEFKKETLNNFITADNNISNSHCSLLMRIVNINEDLQAELKNIRLKLNIGFAAFVLLNLGIIIYLIEKV
jgi:hypothetical protein